MILYEVGTVGNLEVCRSGIEEREKQKGALGNDPVDDKSNH